MDSEISKGEKIDFLLNVLLKSSHVNPINLLDDKFGESKEHILLINEMELLKLIDYKVSYIQEGGKSIPSFSQYSLSKFGMEVINDGGYIQHEKKRKDLEEKQRQLINENLRVAQKTRKYMGWQTIAAIIGGVAGLTALILQLKEPSQPKIKDPSIEVQKIDPTSNNKTNQAHDSATYENEDSLKN